MDHINFYDTSLRLKRDWATAGTALAVVAATVGAVALAGVWARQESKALAASAGAAATAYQAKLAAVTALETRNAGVKPDPAVERRLLDLQATLAHRQAALHLLGRGALQQDSGYSALLLALARQSVDGLWLTQVTMDRGSMTLRGRALRPELIAVYVGRLDGEAVLHGHVFRALDIRRPAEDAAPAAPPLPAGPRRLAAYVDFTLTGGPADAADAAAAATGARS